MDRGVVSEISASVIEQITSDPIAILEASRKGEGNLVRIPSKKRENLYIVNSPVAVTEVLGAGENYQKQLVTDPVARRLFGVGLLTSSGQTWVRQRRVTLRALTETQMVEHRQTFAQETAAMISTLPDPVTIEDALSTFRSLTLRNVSRTLFGVEYPGEPLEFARATDIVNYRGRHEDYALVSGDLVNLDSSMDIEAAFDVIDEVATRFRQARPIHEDTLLASIIETADSGQEIRDEIVTLLISGHETTALAITWALLLLAEDQQTQNLLREELRRVQSSVEASGGAALQSVIAETLRLIPPVYAIGRSVSARTELLGHELSTDSDVIVSQWLLQRHSECFGNADQFIPSRWSSEKSRSSVKGCYFPFGFGPRGCIGERFARTEIAIVLATVLRNRRVSMVSTSSHKVRAALTTRPAFPVRLRFDVVDN